MWRFGYALFCVLRFAFDLLRAVSFHCVIMTYRILFYNSLRKCCVSQNFYFALSFIFNQTLNKMKQSFKKSVDTITNSGGSLTLIYMANGIVSVKARHGARQAEELCPATIRKIEKATEKAVKAVMVPVEITPHVNPAVDADIEAAFPG